MFSLIVQVDGLVQVYGLALIQFSFMGSLISQVYLTEQAVGPISATLPIGVSLIQSYGQFYH